MEKFLNHLQEAERIIKISDHMIYVTFPLIKDKRLLLKILLETKKAVENCVNSILQYEYFYKRISLKKDSKENFRTFENKCSRIYNITQNEICLILELLELAERHRRSTMEFVRNGKVVILSESLEHRIITIEKAKEFLELAKNILRKTKEKIRITN
ncbi:hypothetical protein COU58_03080 [Candidatus Pacearchaeota archaeon CG10_big_fil_rev_8_21_14_0_10_32_42]|nr:MAG: hypothetical protein COU58_03080 [Candidatus Pacearchaeota archaeon CG10_big_fil_rev_8_21_14_0_10_32_42]